MDTRKQTYIVPLTHDGAPALPRDYVYLPPPTDPPYVLRFVVDGSAPICRDGRLWVNIPTTRSAGGEGDPDNRDQETETEREGREWREFK